MSEDVFIDMLEDDDLPSNPESLTPLTDAASDEAGAFFGDSEVVSANFARALERRNAELREALEAIRAQRNNRYESTVSIVCNIAGKALAAQEGGEG